MQKLSAFIIILSFLLLTSLADAQPDTLWTTIIGGDNTILTSAAPLSDNGFVVAGYTRFTSSNSDFYVARIDAAGRLIWEDLFTSSAANEEAHGVVVVDETIFVVGFGERDDQPNSEEVVLFVGLSLNGDSLWSRRYQPDGLSKAREVIRLSDGNVGVIGYKPGVGGQHSDAWFLKCDSNGDTLWTRTYGNTYTDLGQYLKEMPDGSILLLCNSRPGDGENYDLWPVKIDPNGEILSENTVGTVREEYGYGVWVDLDGSILLVGRQSPPTSVRAGYAVGLPAVGSGWTQTYSDDGNYVDLYGILHRMSSSICVGGAGESASSINPFLLGIDEEGNREWSWTIGEDDGGGRFYGIIPIPSDGGGLAFGSQSFDGVLHGFLMRIAPPTGVSGVVVERDSELPLEGVRVVAAGQERFTLTDANGAYSLELVAGTYDLVAYGSCVESDTLWSVVVPEEGQASADFELGVPQFANSQSSVNMMAMNHVESNGFYHLANSGNGTLEFSIAADCIYPPGNWMTLSPVEGIVPAGETRNITVTVHADTTDDGAYAYYGELHIHTNSCPITDCTIPVLVTVLDMDEHPEAVCTFGLDRVYPNPFNSEAAIRFGLEKQDRVSLKVYNTTGQEVAALADGFYTPGFHTIHFSLPSAASGLYFIRLQAGSQSDFRKIALIK